MIQNLAQNKTYIQYDDALIDDDIVDCFSSEFWQQKGKIIGSAQGRGTTWFVQLAQLQGALRHYRRGGLFGKIISDHYIFLSMAKTRSIAEFDLLCKLAESGVNVPRPIAARVVKRHFCYQADLLSEKIIDAQDLVSILQTRALTELEYFAIGRQIKKMHDVQVNHTDLNIHNILLAKQGKIWLIDFDKCYQQGGNNWQAANLQRLLRSFNKERQKRKIRWSENDWSLLMKGYQGGS